MVVRQENGEFEFRFFRPRAQRVLLVGDLNEWRDIALLMTRTPAGEWVCRVRLDPGVFRYRFWADGQWYLDRPESGVERAHFGCDTLVVTEDKGMPAFPVG